MNAALRPIENVAPHPPSLPAYQLRTTRQPMLWAALAYSSGIVAGVYLWRPTLWWIVAGVAFVLAAVYFTHRRTRFAGALALSAFVFVGALHIQMRMSLPRLDNTIQPFADGQEIQITAHVTREGRLREGNFGETQQTLDVKVEDVKTDAHELPAVHSKIRLGIYAPRSSHVSSEDGEPEGQLGSGSDAMPVFRYGQRIRFPAKLKLPRNFRNPGAFDYESYLADNGIAALASTKSDYVELLPGFSGSRIEYWRTRIHNSVIAKVRELWPPREAALINAMVIGEEAFIERDTRADFQRSGTYHVLVVSGMNVTILAFVVFWTLRRMRVPDVPATLITVGLCCTYAFLTEVGAPVWRATLMCAVFLCTRLLYRERAMVNALGAAALGLLLVDPRQLFSASFQMTFICVLLVAAIGLPMLERTSQLYKQALAHWDSDDYGKTLPPRVAQFRVDLRFVAARVALFIGRNWSLRVVRATASLALGSFEALFISAIMQMGLALPMAYYFHRATTIGLPSNVIVVPLTELLMPAAAMAVGLGYISRLLAKVPTLLTTFALHGITGAVHGLGSLRMADMRVATPSMVMILVAVAALVVAMLTARCQMALALGGLALILGASCVLAFLPPGPRIRPGILEVTSIDVGEGDSTLLVTPQGRTLLIDAGGPIGGPSGSQLDFGEDVVSPYLWTRGIERLDAVAITHGHSDHIGGMGAVLKNFRPKELWVGLLPPSAALKNLIVEAQALQITVVRHWEGDEFNLGGATVDVLYPPRDLLPGIKPENNDSMILHVSFGNSSVLLEGDAQTQVERHVAALHQEKSSLLRVGHHGSANATTAELLDAVKPEYAVISVGMRNPFHLPRTEILDRLARSGARVYRTDVEGAVTFYLDGHTVTPSVASLQ